MNRRTFSTSALAGSAGLFSALLARKAGAQGVGAEVGSLDTWRPRGASARRTAGRPDRAKLVRQIWESYGLAEPNYYDTVEVFCSAMLADWQREQSTYVWRYASLAGNQVYVLPRRFLLMQPAFLPDFPTGYYWLDPACEPDEGASCIHPNAFFRILPAESVDEYAPGEIIPTVRA
jgi:hypothetical protein